MVKLNSIIKGIVRDTIFFCDGFILCAELFTSFSILDKNVAPNCNVSYEWEVSYEYNGSAKLVQQTPLNMQKKNTNFIHNYRNAFIRIGKKMY